MFSEQNQQVNVRQLRDGRTEDGVCESLEGSHLQFRLLAPPEPGAFNAGELVEVNATRTLYLGEITGRQDNLILIVVEHALNRDALAAIHGPKLGLDNATCFDYLTKVLSYDLGEPEVAGLRRFARMTAALGLAPEGVDLVFHRRRDLATRR